MEVLDEIQKILNSWHCRLKYNNAGKLPANPSWSNGSPSKNPDIKTPLVVSFSLGIVRH